MRTRDEIEEEGLVYQSSGITLEGRIASVSLEVLLDIRDLLTPKEKDVGDAVDVKIPRFGPWS